MEYGRFGKDLVEAAQSEAKCVASKTAKNIGLSREDQEDLEQNLVLAVLEKAEAYDPSRASVRTFVQSVVKGAILHELRRRRRASERELVSASINDDVFDGEEMVSAHETMDRAEHLGRMGKDIPDPFQLSDVRSDVSAIMGQLTAEQRSLASALSESDTRTAAKQTGISRRAMYRQIGAIRNIMSDAGLRVYASKSGTRCC